MSDFVAHVEDLQKNDFETASTVGGNNHYKKDQEISEVKKSNFSIIEETEPEKYKIFDINKFASELKFKSSIKNRYQIEEATNISAYDVAANCIRQIIYKLNHMPVPDYSTKWLPIFLRSQIGSACHDFIQNYSKQFEESEISIKVPSIRFSGRIDNMIGPEILVEIKSCTYKDYAEVIKHRSPKLEHFRQALTYKYILENYLKEVQDPNIKTRSNKPKFSKYNIKYIQFIYLAQDIISADMEDISSSLKAVDNIKKQDLIGNRDDFQFMTSLTINTENNPVVNENLNFIKNKIEAINYYMNSSKAPTNEDPFVDKSGCHFCIFNKVCDLNKN